MNALLLSLALLGGNPLTPAIPKPPPPDRFTCVDCGWLVEIHWGRDGLWTSRARIIGLGWDVVRAACEESPWFWVTDDIDTNWFSMERERVEAIEYMGWLHDTIVDEDSRRVLRRYHEWLCGE